MPLEFHYSSITYLIAARARKIEKRPAPTLIPIAILQNGIIPALHRCSGVPFGRKFKKNVPAKNNPKIAIPMNRSPPILSNTEAVFDNFFSELISLPKARNLTTKAPAIITPPAKPPPGVR